jgi:hypothetical protein
MARRQKEERRASHHEKCEAIGSLLLPYAATGVSLRAVWCLRGVTLGGSRGRLPWHYRMGATG